MSYLRDENIELRERINKALELMKYKSQLDREDMFLVKQILEGEDISKHITFID